jgi:hypothetical protein
MAGISDALRALFPNAESGTDYRVENPGTGDRIAFWNSAIGTQPTQQQLEAVTQGAADTAALQVSYARAKALLTADDPISKKEKAVLLVILDEFNAHATKINAVLTAFDQTTYAAARTAAQAITDYPQRTAAQIKTSVANKIDAGDANG